MIVLGIESTAHTFGVGIVEDGKVIANEKSSYTTDEGGMVLHKVQKHHVDCCEKILKKALKKANKKIENVNLISFSQGPGIGPCLQIGAVVARTLHLIHKIPLIGVNHCIAHLTIGEQLSKVNDAILLYVSGANTQVIAFEAGKYRIFGETLDNGIGNLLDKSAREMGLGFPGGPKISEMAKGGKYIEMPYVVKGMDVSFGGLFTEMKRMLKKHSKKDICYSLQETIFAMVIEVAERAIAHTGKTDLVLGGGVACNERLKEMCQKMCEERGAKLHIIPNEYFVDNGAMIAMEGYVEYKHKKTSNTAVNPYERTDDVEVTWR